MSQTKYYTISEVSEILDIPQTSLRYLEKIISRFKVRKIRGRRYYTQENIEILRKKIGNNDIATSPQYNLFENAKPAIKRAAIELKSKNISKLPNITNILQKISNLEQKFISLKSRLL